SSSSRAPTRSTPKRSTPEPERVHRRADAPRFVVVWQAGSVTVTRARARPVPPARPGSRSGAVLPAVVTALAAVAGLIRLAGWALQTRAGQAWDQSGMDAVYGGSRALRRVLGLLGEISIGSAGLVLAVCVGLALLRHRYAAAIGAVVLVGGANVPP